MESSSPAMGEEVPHPAILRNFWTSALLLKGGTAKAPTSLHPLYGVKIKFP